MWKIKTFKTYESMRKFIQFHKIQYIQIFINNVPFAIEYKKLRRVY